MTLTSLTTLHRPPESSLEGRSHFPLVQELSFPLRTSPSWFWLAQTPWKTPWTLSGVGTSTQMSRGGLKSLLSQDLTLFSKWSTTPNISTPSLQKTINWSFIKKTCRLLQEKKLWCYCKVFGCKSRESSLTFHHVELQNNFSLVLWIFR